MYRGVLKVAGVILILYYIILTIISGFAVLFNFVWLFAGVFLIGASFLKPGKIRMAVCIVTASAVVFTGIFMFPIVKASHMEPVPGADYIIVLGAHVRADNRPCGVLYYRLSAALDYQKENPDARFIVTGGQGSNENISEAECMKNWLLENGISENRIILENKASNTYENIIFSKAIINDSSKTSAIVTSDFHIYRAMKLAEEQGMEHVTGIPSFTRRILLPNYYVREVAAVIKDFYL